MMRFLVILSCLFFSGCAMLPEIRHQPDLHNPFPQLTKIAVAPFFNLSHEPTLDGRKVAAAYANELQLVPGFEVVAVGVVERAMERHQIMLRGPGDARMLAQILEVDAVVIGAVSDYTPYYPPRMALQVEWYTANPCFHPIPPGYGLPLGTPEAKDIPDSLIFEAQMAAARAELEGQTPKYTKTAVEMPMPQSQPLPSAVPPPGALQGGAAGSGIHPPPVAGLPSMWPDRQPRASGQDCPAPLCLPSGKPVLQHTRTYNGNEAHFVAALKTYHDFRADARLGGWQGYLQRSEDFARFCCHMSIWEMFSARGGAGPSKVVWRWPRKTE